MATPEHPRPESATTPDVVTTTPQSFASADYSFTLQAVFEMQKSTGQLIEAVNSLKTVVEKQSDRIHGVEEKLSGVTHKIYAATVVLTILVAIGAFIVSKAWDLAVRQLTSRTEIISPIPATPTPNPTPPNKKSP